LNKNEIENFYHFVQCLDAKAARAITVVVTTVVEMVCLIYQQIVLVATCIIALRNTLREYLKTLVLSNYALRLSLVKVIALYSMNKHSARYR
jgi:hypothetical protein